MKRHQRTHNKNTSGKNVVLTEAFLTAFRGGNKRPLMVSKSEEEETEAQGMDAVYGEEVNGGNPYVHPAGDMGI